MIEINKNPSRRDLVVFASLLPVFFALVGTLAWRGGSPRIATALWGIGGAISLLALLAPRLRRRMYLGWMYASYPIAWTVSHLILAAAYFLVATPIALALRLAGRDPMQRKIDKAATSYWVLRKPDRNGARHFRQF